MGYIPNRDADLVAWGLNYTDRITATPMAYGLQAADALILQTNYDEFVTAYNLAVNPPTRTIVTVAAKDEERAGFVSLARAYANIIQANEGVTPEQIAELGLTVRDTTPTPIPTPTTQPVLALPGS